MQCLFIVFVHVVNSFILETIESRLRDNKTVDLDLKKALALLKLYNRDKTVGKKEIAKPRMLCTRRSKNYSRQ